MGKYQHTWYRWNLGYDFLLMLNKFSRLPLELPIEKLILSLNQKKDYKADKVAAESETKLAINLKDQKINQLTSELELIKSAFIETEDTIKNQQSLIEELKRKNEQL